MKNLTAFILMLSVASTLLYGQTPPTPQLIPAEPIHSPNVICVDCIGFPIPMPTTYTLDQLKAGLHAAQLVALVEVKDTSTITSGDYIGWTNTSVRIKAVYKGDIEPEDSIIHILTSNFMPYAAAQPADLIIGGYTCTYEIGQRSILMMSDAGLNGRYAYADCGSQFIISDKDSVLAPVSSIGFSTDFDAYQTLQSFGGFLVQTVIQEEYLQLIPFMPKSTATLKFRTGIDLSGGGVLNSGTATEMISASKNRINVDLTYTPCTGACITLYKLLDTTITLGRPTKTGSYSAYRYKTNSLLDYFAYIPDDSVSFTVYGTTNVKPYAIVTNSVSRSINKNSIMFDVRGRAVGSSFQHEAISRGVYFKSTHLGLHKIVVTN